MGEQGRVLSITVYSWHGPRELPAERLYLPWVCRSPGAQLFGKEAVNTPSVLECMGRWFVC
jgi:hypothetical protein